MQQPSITVLEKNAVSALNRGDFKSLEALSAAILAKDSARADAWFFLSIVAEVRGQIQIAHSHIDKALSCDAGNTEYLTQKAKLFSAVNDIKYALEYADLALANKPNSAVVLDALGVIYNRNDCQHKARQVFRLAIDKKSNNPQYHFNLAAVEKYLGNEEQAELHYETAIQLNPLFCRAHWALSELEKNKPSPKRIDRLLTLSRNNTLNEVDNLYIAHALSREFEKQGDYFSAFNHLTQAKKKRRLTLGYDISRDESLFSQIQATFFKPITINNTSELGEDTIFVLGMPRSGTTLVERIIASHSQIHSLGELRDFQQAVKSVSKSHTKALLDEDTLAKAMVGSSNSIGEYYLNLIKHRKGNEKYFIDKMPLNFLYIGFIVNALPKAKIICLRRNPLDTIVSNYRQLFAVGFSYYNYHYSLEDTARYFALFHHLMEFWQDLFKARIYSVDYENLVSNPEPEIRSLFFFLAIPFEEQCLHFHKSKAPVTTASANQVRQPIYQSSVARWKHYDSFLGDAKKILTEQGVHY